MLNNKIIAPFCFNGTCDSSLFNLWIKKILIPVLKPGQTIVIDNASFHKSKETRSLINNAGCTLLFLPPYSPDLNPIEKFWANLKRKIRNIKGKFNSLQNTIDYAFNSFE